MKIAIVGAGLIGRLCAWQCIQQGIDVSLFDEGSSQGEQSAAWVAAAMLAPLSESVRSDNAIYSIGIKSLAAWPKLIQQLTEQSGQTIHFQNNGSLIIAHAQDQSHLLQFSQHLQNNPQINKNNVRSLNQQQLAQIEPLIAERFNKALYLDNEGCIDNRQLLDALSIVLQQRCQWFEHTKITTLAANRIRVDQQTMHFDCVIDCRGAGAIGSINDLRGVRGEIIWVQAPEIKLRHAVRLMHPRYQIYIAPHAHNIFAIGATEIESSSNKAISVRSSLELLSALYSVSSRFSEASVIASYARLRPAFSNHLPRIIHQDGLIQVNGLYRHGYLLAPVVLHDLMQCITNNAVTDKQLLWPTIYHNQLTQQSPLPTYQGAS